VELPTIFHLDADAFFVSCEQARDPSLRGKKCAVGGSERGIISSASYEAGRAGLHPDADQEGLQACPISFAAAHVGPLRGVSHRMFDLCERLTPVVQRNSIDEGYLDVSPCGWKTCADVEAAGRACRGGSGTNFKSGVIGNRAHRLVAQIASKLRNRADLSSWRREKRRPSSPAGDRPAAGNRGEDGGCAGQARNPVRSGYLRPHGVGACGDFGDGWRAMLAQARGEDDRPVETGEESAKSYSEQTTFLRDVGDFAEIERVAKGMLDNLMSKVRADRKRVRTLTVNVRYPDFTHESHGHSLGAATDLEAPFYPMIGPLLRAAWRKRRPSAS